MRAFDCGSHRDRHEDHHPHLARAAESARYCCRIPRMSERRLTVLELDSGSLGSHIRLGVWPGGRSSGRRWPWRGGLPSGGQNQGGAVGIVTDGHFPANLMNFVMMVQAGEIEVLGFGCALVASPFFAVMGFDSPDQRTPLRLDHRPGRMQLRREYAGAVLHVEPAAGKSVRKPWQFERLLQNPDVCRPRGAPPDLDRQSTNSSDPSRLEPQFVRYAAQVGSGQLWRCTQAPGLTRHAVGVQQEERPGRGLTLPAPPPCRRPP